MNTTSVLAREDRSLAASYRPVITRFAAPTKAAARGSTARVAGWLPDNAARKELGFMPAGFQLPTPKLSSKEARQNALAIDQAMLKQVAHYYQVALPSESGPPRGPYADYAALQLDYRALVHAIGEFELPRDKPGPWRIELRIQANTDARSTHFEAFAAIRSEVTKTWKVPFIFSHSTTRVLGPCGCVPYFSYDLTDGTATDRMGDVPRTFAERGSVWFQRSDRGTFTEPFPPEGLSASGRRKTIKLFGQSRSTESMKTARLRLPSHEAAQPAQNKN